jgi:hypothetical protein
MTNSPTFVAHFADGEVTRMTTSCDSKKFDQRRGVCLARHAYRSRCRKEPPAIVKANFERDGEVLAEYTAEQLAEVAS